MTMMQRMQTRFGDFVSRHIYRGRHPRPGTSVSVAPEMTFVRPGTVFSHAEVEVIPPKGQDTDLHPDLHDLVKIGKLEDVEKRLMTVQGKSEINKKDRHGVAPIHYAVRYSHLDVLKVLRENGADVNLEDENGLTPLHYATRFKKKDSKMGSQTDAVPRHHSAFIPYLIKHRAKVDACDNHGQTPLHHAAMTDNKRAYKDLTVSDGVTLLQKQDHQGMTPLHSAVYHQSTDMVWWIVQDYPDNPNILHVKDKQNNTPLHLACAEGYDEIAKILVDAAERIDGQKGMKKMMTEQNSEGNTCLSLAVQSGNPKLVKICLEIDRDAVDIPNKKGNKGMFPLHHAAVKGNEKIVDLLREKGADIDVLNSNDATPLHKAIQHGNASVVQKLTSGTIINRQDKQGNTPLLLACRYGNTTIIEELLKQGADVTFVDKDRKTAVLIAMEQNQEIALKVVKILRQNHDEKKENKGIIHMFDYEGNLPLHVAVIKGHNDIVKNLLKASGDISKIKNNKECTLVHLAARFGHEQILLDLLKKKNESVLGLKDINFNTALHLAAREGHVSIVNILLNKGADVAVRNIKRWTPLHYAAAGGWFKTVSALLEADSDTDVDPTDETGTTPLHLAVKSDHTKVTKLLIERGADVSKTTSAGFNCLDIAIDNNKESTAAAIIDCKEWKDVLKNATQGKMPGCPQTPMRKLIRTMPGVAKQVMDRCITPDENDSNNTLTFDFTFLDDTHLLSIDKNTKNPKFKDDDGKSGPYTKNRIVYKRNHPLRIMTSNKRVNLLNHPLVSALLRKKWLKFGRMFFTINIGIYVFFLGFLTAYMWTTDPPYSSSDQTCESILSHSKSEQLPFFVQWGTTFILTLVAFRLYSELAELRYTGRKYFENVENLLEWTAYVTTALLVAPLDTCQWNTGYREHWQWQVGAVAIFLSWFNFALFTQKLYTLGGIYVVMFKTICATFFKFSFVFITIVLAFTFSFHALFRDQDSFSTVQRSVVKTLVMTTGEFDYGTIFEENTLHYPDVSYFIFCCFVIIMPIIIINLLVGLAVGNIEEIQKISNTKRTTMVVNLILDFEKALPDCIRRHDKIEKRTEDTETSYYKKIQRFLGRFVGLESYAHGEQAIFKNLKEELEKHDEHEDDLPQLQTSVSKMETKMDKLEEMIKAIMEHHKISRAQEAT